jgi:putative transposase
MSRAQRRAMIERVNPMLPVSQQCRLLAVSRAAVYRKPAEVSAEDLAIMALIDRQYLARPYYGSRRMAAWLATQGHVVNRKRIRRLMRLLRLMAIYQRPNTSKPAAAHKIYPYLLGGIAIERATAAFENARRPVQQLLLPVVDPVRMNAELTRQLGDRPVPPTTATTTPSL